MFLLAHQISSCCFSLFFPGELQPMASSASVASLVITLETGLSDEEGPLEQSHLGDKSWEEEGPRGRNRSHEWLRFRLYTANADRHPSLLASLLQNSAGLPFGLKMKNVLVFIFSVLVPFLVRLFQDRLYSDQFQVVQHFVRSPAAPSVVTRDRKRTISHLNICGASVATFATHSWRDSERIVCQQARTLKKVETFHNWIVRHCSTGLQCESRKADFCETSHWVLPGAVNGSFFWEDTAPLFWLPRYYSSTEEQCHSVICCVSLKFFFFFFSIVSWFLLQSGIISHVEVRQRSLRETMLGCAQKVLCV